MQKELKLLDQELKSNGLCRIPDTNNRSEHSLFRALGMAVFMAHGYNDQVLREIRLTLVDNLKDKRHSAYPLIHQSNILAKYHQQNELVLDYWEAPDLNCFHRDNLVAASAAFAKTICLYSMDKEEYLNVVYTSASKNAHHQKVRLAKVGKKYYAVMKISTKQVATALRQWIVDELLEGIFKAQPKQPSSQLESRPQTQKEDKIHYPNYDEVVTGAGNRKKHKKSLSDCGQTIQQSPLFEDGKEELQPPLLTSVASSRLPAPRNNLLDFLEQEVLDGNKVQQGYAIDPGYGSENPPSYGDSMNYYHNYSYPYGVAHQQQYPFMEHQQQQQVALVNNQRYTGRLKFFDQAGNYGFIVIDNINADLFVHYDDLSKAGLNKEALLSVKNNYELRFEFTYYEYEGKQHKKSKKAVDLTLILTE